MTTSKKQQEAITKMDAFFNNLSKAPKLSKREQAEQLKQDRDDLRRYKNIIRSLYDDIATTEQTAFIDNATVNDLKQAENIINTLKEQRLNAYK